MSECVDPRRHLAGNMRSGRHRPLHEHAATDHHVHFSRMPGYVDLEAFGRRLVADYQLLPRCGDVAVTLTTRRLRVTRLEDRVDSFGSAYPCRGAAGERRRKYAVNADRADAARMPPHVRER